MEKGCSSNDRYRVWLPPPHRLYVAVSRYAEGDGAPDL